MYQVDAHDCLFNLCVVIIILRPCPHESVAVDERADSQVSCGQRADWCKNNMQFYKISGVVWTEAIFVVSCSSASWILSSCINKAHIWTPLDKIKQTIESIHPSLHCPYRGRATLRCPAQRNWFICSICASECLVKTFWQKKCLTYLLRGLAIWSLQCQILPPLPYLYYSLKSPRAWFIQTHKQITTMLEHNKKQNNDFLLVMYNFWELKYLLLRYI